MTGPEIARAWVKVEWSNGLTYELDFASGVDVWVQVDAGRHQQDDPVGPPKGKVTLSGDLSGVRRLMPDANPPSAVPAKVAAQ